jgi:hypothetical protein
MASSMEIDSHLEVPGGNGLETISFAKNSLHEFQKGLETLLHSTPNMSARDFDERTETSLFSHILFFSLSQLIRLNLSSGSVFP